MGRLLQDPDASTEMPPISWPRSKSKPVIAVLPPRLLAKDQSQPQNQIRWKYGASIPLTMFLSAGPRNSSESDDTSVALASIHVR